MRVSFAPAPILRVMSDENLDAVRERIRLIDNELVARAAERLALVKQVGEIKRRLNLPTVDYAHERAVLERARAAATEHGLDPRIAEDLLARLIRASVGAQEHERLRFSTAGVGKRAVIVGGAGRMGKWTAHFLTTQGFTTGALDPAASAEENAWARDALATADLVVMAAAPGVTAKLYGAWVASPPRGVVIDIASIKTPLLEPIRALQRSGCCVGSIHPMFGPSIALLRDADVVVCDTGDERAIATVQEIYASTTARIVRIPLADHDRLMADLLSLAHATAIAFAVALPATPQPVRSTTFRALESLAAAVVRESPDVYYEIQAKNPYSAQAIERLRDALARLVSATANHDSAAFRALLEEGQARADPLGGGIAPA